LFGDRVNKDGAHDAASQIQLGWKLTY